MTPVYAEILISAEDVSVLPVAGSFLMEHAIRLLKLGASDKYVLLRVTAIPWTDEHLDLMLSSEESFA